MIMKPDRSNYEIWLIDWSDGNLSDEQVALLRSFLEENPDLKAEAEAISFPFLTSPGDSFGRKDLLKRTPEEMESSQVEYLSVGWLENDLNPEQLVDLEHSIKSNPANRKLFESIQKIRLKPSQAEYKNKSLLIRHSPGSKIFRLSLMVSGAAATVALLVLSILFVPRYLQSKRNVASRETVADTSKSEPDIAVIPVIPVPARQETVRTIKESVPHITAVPVPSYSPVNKETSDSSSYKRNTLQEQITGLPVPKIMDMDFHIAGNILQPSGIDISQPEEEDDRSKLEKFIARVLRQNILQEEVPDNTPLKGYEIAEAGIEGLNKLLGWDMALVKTNDEKGELKSLYFSSKVLKFNAPIKKAEQVQ